MGQLIVIQFVTLDGVVEDPDGRSGTPGGGWAFRYGPEAIAGDAFHLGPVLDDGVLLFGRKTWQHFAGLWPTRTDPFSTRMNALPKYVVTRQPLDPGTWSSSRVLQGDVVAGSRALTDGHDAVVIGSISLVRQLAAAGAVDEYRLLTFPSFLGAGTRLFETPVDLELAAQQTTGPVTLSTYRPVPGTGRPGAGRQAETAALSR